jgi:prepilin-type N-terminal cleavage/methylation domain-containing protein
MRTATGAGFTVIELITALAIIAVLTASASPAWNNFIASYNLSSSARVVHSELQALRIRAAAENVGFRLAYAAGGATIEIERDGAIVARKPLPSGILITQSGSIAFSPRGTASANRVRLSNGERSCRQVIVSATGRVRGCIAACNKDC